MIGRLPCGMNCSIVWAYMQFATTNSCWQLGPPWWKLPWHSADYLVLDNTRLRDSLVVARLCLGCEGKTFH